MRNSFMQLGAAALAAMEPKALNGMRRRRPGYSPIAKGVRSPEWRPGAVSTTHVTAKTHRQVPCTATPSAASALADHVNRLQMLKDRRNAEA